MFGIATTLLGAVLAFGAGAAGAGETVKIGVIAEFSGPFADYGAQILGGMKVYLKQNGEVFGGRKVELLVRDTTGAAPDIAKRFAQELVTRDNVDILAGFGLTPNALAVAPVATQAKKPMVIMNAATSIITTKSPYIVRVSHTMPQNSQPMAQWAAKNGIKRVYTLVSDFGPGIDTELRSSRRSKPPAEKFLPVYVRLFRTPTSRRSSSASRTPGRKRCSFSCRREARRSRSSRPMRSAGSSKPA